MADLFAIRQYVEKNSEVFLDRLKEACSIPSVSAEGTGLVDMADWLEGKLEELGAKVTRLEVPDAPTALLGEISGPSERTLMIYNHYDVQPVDPIDLWESPPFEPTIRDGKLFARGVADNKGDLMARLCAIETYKEVVGDLPFNIKFFVEGEEETGSRKFEEICRKFAGELRSDDCIWEGGGIDHEGRPSIFFGCKGLLYIELRSKKLSGDQHSSLAAIVPSAAWRVLQAIASMRDADGNIVIDGFLDDVRQPSQEELRLAEDLPYEEAAEKLRLGIDSFIGGLTGSALKKQLLFLPTANVAGFVSGYTVPRASKTVLPAEAMAKMDFRLVPEQRADDIFEKVERHLQKHGFDDVEVEALGEENPSVSPLDSTLGVAVRSSTSQWWDKPAKIWPLMYATGPMYPIANVLGIPICSPPGVGRPDAKIHAPNENARIDDYLEIVGSTAAYLDEYART